MKKIILSVALLGVLSILTTNVFAQYKKGDKLLNLGIGLNSYYSGGIPVGASFEYGVTDDISVGGSLDYLSYHYAGYANNYNFSALYVAGRGSYHFNRLLNLRIEKLDIYAGLSLGYRSVSWNNGYNSSGLGNQYGSSLFLGVHAGARYYFTKTFGVFAELGALGSTNAKTGVAFRF